MPLSNRRRFLRACAAGSAATLALPLLDLFLNDNGTALATGKPLPKRFGVFFWGNGVLHEHWLPATVGRGWKLPAALEPLESVKDYVSVVSGLELKFGGESHNGAHAEVVSGAHHHDEEGKQLGPSRPSVDQLVADAWRGQTPFHSLQLGVSAQAAMGYVAKGKSCRDRYGYINAEFSPQAVFQRLFVPEDALERSARTSVLDAVQADARALHAGLGAADRARLEQHLDGFRALEKRLGTGPGSCSRPETPELFNDTLDRELLAERHQAMAKLVAYAFSCDLTRVFSLQFTQSKADTLFWQVGANEGLHAMGHLPGRAGDPGYTPRYAMIQRTVRFTMARFGELLSELRATPEGDGNVLDHCCIYACSEYSDGTTHATEDLPTLVAGKASGKLQAGIHQRMPAGTGVSELLLTCARSVDVKLESLGVDEAEATRGIPQLLT